MSQAVYVLSVVGESPAVLSELLWRLTVVERCSLAGIEVWATGRGATALRAMTQTDAWTHLTAQTGPLPTLLATDCEPDSSFAFKIHTLKAGGAILDDVRSKAQSEAVSGTLHDRVRALRGQLRPHIQLVGSLAGGRKTVSAALQTAFCLQAGVEDRLVHVLLNPTLDTWLRDHQRLREYCCPTPEWHRESGIKEADQVLVYDVPFPRVKHLVRGRLREVLATKPYAAFWPVMQQHLGRKHRASLRRVDDKRWVFSIVESCSKQAVFEEPLRERPGALFAAIIEFGGTPSSRQLLEHLDAHELGWRPTGSPTGKAAPRLRAIRQGANEIRKRLNRMPMALAEFSIPDTGYAAPPVELVDNRWKPLVFEK